MENFYLQLNDNFMRFCVGLFVIILLPLQGIAQTNDQIVVPLTRPGENGLLRIGLVTGSIEVTGYNGKEVIVEYKGNADQEDKRKDPPSGMRRIPDTSFGLRIREEDNEVTIKHDSPNKKITVKVMVPLNFSLKLSTVNSGSLEVSGIQGEMEVSNVNGDISISDVSGSVVANTVNGNLTVSFEKIAPDTPMSFTTLNGKVAVTLPATAKVDTKISTLNGEIYTDFDINLNSGNGRVVNTSREDGVYRVDIDRQIYGKINGGGPEMVFKSHNGDIYIKKR